MHTDVKRFYAVLEIDPGASDDAIRGAFRRRAKELHPDAQSGNTGAFILLKRAYDTLIDHDRRAAYDYSCRLAPRPPPSRSPPPHTPPSDPAPPRRPPPRPSQDPLSRSRPDFAAPPPRPMRPRRGGVGLMRYVIAFLVMAALSIGTIEAMISLIEAPPSIQARSGAYTDARTDAASPPTTQVSAAPGSSNSGFWDPTPAAPDKKTP